MTDNCLKSMIELTRAQGMQSKMSTSVQSGRVTKSRAKPSQRKSSSRQNQPQPDQDEQHRSPLPLVERTNDLPIEQFRSTYMPSTYESFKAPAPTREPPDTKDDSDPEKRGMNYILDIYTAKSISDADFEACFGLIELTSSNAYNGSSVGWSPVKKRKEMKLPDMRYLIARQGLSNGNPEPDEPSAPTQGQILGFLSFMVTYEDGKEVIYCYEIHMSPTAQGLGLGKQLMLTFEDIGRRIGLEKAMLTVFKSNTIALRFYDRLGFAVDEYSPQPRKLRNGTVKEADYLILSKRLDNIASSAAEMPEQ